MQASTKDHVPRHAHDLYLFAANSLLGTCKLPCCARASAWCSKSSEGQLHQVHQVHHRALSHNFAEVHLPTRQLLLSITCAVASGMMVTLR